MELTDKEINYATWVSWATLIFIGVFVMKFGNQFVDIQLYDTHFVVSNSFFALAFGLLTFIIGLIYFVFDKIELQFKSYFVITHVVGTCVFTMASLWILAILSQSSFSYLHLRKVFNYRPPVHHEILVIFWLIVVSLNIILQSLFLLNCLLAIIRKIFSR